ncbi:hypothetical protein chiPu_0026095, partial [Chiloscyllium punctatum]|nr:hypothetical protein [Chiloscyllium punctatum]
MRLPLTQAQTSHRIPSPSNRHPLPVAHSASCCLEGLLQHIAIGTVTCYSASRGLEGSLQRITTAAMICYSAACALEESLQHITNGVVTATQHPL